MNANNYTNTSKPGPRIVISQEDWETVDRILAATAVDEDDESTPLEAGWAHMQSSRGWR